MSEREADHPSMLSAEEVKAALRELFGNTGLQKGMRAVLPEDLVLYIARTVETVETIADFQEKIILPFLQFVQQRSMAELTVSGLEQLHPSEGHLFISNHRDIVLDSAFLNKTLFENGFETSQIAIGDNLMKHRNAELLFRLNKSFVVKRTGAPIALYRYSVALSQYIFRQVSGENHAVWIAQREGRAKDGDDRTQQGVLKMLSLSATQPLAGHLRSLNIVPVSISYEYDPCDLLKTLEYLQKLADPDYRKTFEEDVRHMLQGIQGFKGKVHFHFGHPLREQLDVLDAQSTPKQQLDLLASLIDQSIHRHYALQAVNYLAYDWLFDKQEAEGRFDEAALEAATEYLATRLASLPAAQQEEGRTYLLRMYANPLINQLAAQ